jgi:hypothetical protein
MSPVFPKKSFWISSLYRVVLLLTREDRWAPGCNQCDGAQEAATVDISDPDVKDAGGFTQI